MKNKKKIIVLIVLILLVAGLSVFSIFAYKNYQREKALKAEAQKAEITEVFHDQGGDYVSTISPQKDEKLVVRLRCEKYNLTKAQVQVTTDEGTTWTAIDMTVDGKDDTGYYQFWKGTIPAQSEPYFYRFAVSNEANVTQYYGAEGLKSYQLDTDEMFYVIPGFNTPEWSQGTLWYYAHIGQFNNGDTSNDLYREQLMKDDSYGNDLHSMTRNSGDIEGLIDKLDYIQSLGVKSLAVGPYFSSQEMFGFGIDNMSAVETAFGNETALKDLINDVHSRDMKITTDMIISYTTAGSKYFNEFGAFPYDGAYQSKDSKYFDMFKFPQWPYNAVKIWSSMGLNVGNEKAAGLIYKDADSMVLKYLNEPYGLDGYRFDAEESVGNLGYEYNPEEIFTNIGKAIKGVSQDKLMLSENPDGIGDQYNTLFDSSWQKNGYFAMKSWFEGSSSGTDMLKVLQDNLINTARPRALSSYNFLGQHDVVRMFSNTEGQKNSIQSLLLLQMTYLGSPVIYFGDEIGMTKGEYENQVAQAFNWDESQWDYKILNLVKSMGNLREKYTCLQNGVVCQGEISDPEMFFAFGRFDDDGAVITLTNRQLTNIQEEINVSRYNICDGDVLTDYLTGKTYKVKNGKITVDIIPGGTVLVTGDDVSEYREDYIITEVGKDIEVLQTEQNIFEITGKGSIEGTKDKIGLMEKKVFNNVSAMATMSEKSHGVIMLREDNDRDSAMYAAEYEDGTLVIKARYAKGEKVKEITKIDITKGSSIKIVRSEDNKFTTLYRDGGEGGWINIDGSSASISMNEQIYMGVTSLKDTTVFSNILTEEAEQQYYDDFDNDIVSSMLTVSDKDVNINNGKLKLASTDDKITTAKANAHTSDWTFKTEMSSVWTGEDIAYAGIMCEANSEDRIVLARTKENGKNVIAVARHIQGKWQIAASVEDTKPSDKVTLQLQRIGSSYTAVASYDGKEWFNVCDGVYCNYTRMYAGAFTYNAEAEFEYVCFGDSINDKISTNTPITLGKRNISAREEMSNLEVDMMSFLGNEDSWSDIGAGYGKTTTDGLALIYLKNKIFEDVKAEATIKITDGAGNAGILVGKQEYSQDTSKCYKIGFDNSGKLFIEKDNKKIATTDVEQGEDGLRIIVRRENGYVNVLTGEKSIPVLSVKDSTYGKGYIAYYADNTAVEIINYDVTTLKPSLHSTMELFGTDETIEIIQEGALVYLERVALTNGCVSFKAQTDIPEVTNDDDSKTEAEIKKEKAENANEIGVIIGNSYGRLAKYGGMQITYNYYKGTIKVCENEEEVAKKEVTKPDTVSDVEFKIVVNKGKYDIYFNGSKKPVLSVNSKTINGGAIAFYSSKNQTRFKDIVIEDTTNAKSHKIKQSTATGKGFKTDFSDYLGWSQNFRRIKTDGASWLVEDGVLAGHSKVKNWNVANVSNGEYKNVDISFKFRFAPDEDITGTFSLGLGKKQMYGDCNESDIYLRIMSTGLVLLNEQDNEEVLSGWDTYLAKLQEWHTVQVRIENNQATLWVDNSEICKSTLTNYTGGYIAMQNDFAEVEIDDLEIKPIG